MTTAIIGTGNIGGQLADELGPLASAASVRQAIAGGDVVVLAVWLDTTKEVIAQNKDLLHRKVIVDPSNPIQLDGKGGFSRTLPDGQSAASVTSEGPARTWDLWPKKGAIQIGSDADLTIVDLQQDGVIREDDLHGKNNINPFEGHRTKGMAVATVVRGAIQMKDGMLTGRSGHGRLQSPLVAVPAGH
jgi:hypothetical protein